MFDPQSSLYATWFNNLPGMFKAMMPMAGAGTFMPPFCAGDDSKRFPFPGDNIGKALEMTSTMLSQFCQSWLPALAQGGFGPDALNNLASASEATFAKLRETLTPRDGDWLDARSLNAAQFAQPLHALFGAMAAPRGSFEPGPMPGPGGDAANLLQLGMERTFGGLSDAFGLRPVRDLDEAWRDMLAAGAGKQRAQLEYLVLWAEAWNEGTRRLVKELTAMGARGERIESMLALIRLWARNVDGAVHEAMQSDRGLAITAEVIQKASTHREHLQKAIELVSESLHVPTRADMDQAYREIQELKREVRRLRKALPVPRRENTQRKQKRKSAA